MPRWDSRPGAMAMPPKGEANFGGRPSDAIGGGVEPDRGLGVPVEPTREALQEASRGFRSTAWVAVILRSMVFIARTTAATIGLPAKGALR